MKSSEMRQTGKFMFTTENRNCRYLQSIHPQEYSLPGVHLEHSNQQELEYTVNFYSQLSIFSVWCPLLAILGLCLFLFVNYTYVVGKVSRLYVMFEYCMSVFLFICVALM